MPDISLPRSKPLSSDPPTIHEHGRSSSSSSPSSDDEKEPSSSAVHHPSPPRPVPDHAGSGSTWEFFFGADPTIPGPGEILPDKIFANPKPIPNPSSSIDIQEKAKAAACPPSPPPPPPPPPSHQDHLPPRPENKESKRGITTESKRGKMIPLQPRSISLLQIFNQLDDQFLKASEAAHEVSKMLEATRMHYHSNFADNRGHIDHSARVMRVITWNRSIKGLPNADAGKDDLDDDEWETHATVLDKMLAWEKKLYDEVKAGEVMKIEYQRKVALLSKQKKRGAKPESLEKIKAAVSQLHTRYIVDMQSMDSTVSEINHLRDGRLYPKLVSLVDEMANMWEALHKHHDAQFKIVADLRGLDLSTAPKETSQQHYERTVQLWQVVREWHTQFQNLVKHQKEYIRALSSWLRLNMIPIESSLREKVSSPPRVSPPKIQDLLNAWYEQLEKLPDELAKNVIFSFSEVINGIMMHQQDELKLKGKCDDTRKEYIRRTRAFEDWYHKYSERKARLPEVNGPEDNEGLTQKDADPVAERKLVLESLKSRLEEETEAHQKLCRQVREKSLGSLKTHLPELFRSMSEFAAASSEMYRKLRSIAQPAESSVA